VTAGQPQFLASAANPLFKDLRRLAQDGAAYRKQGRVWLEGDHLCRAALARGVRPAYAVFAQQFWDASGRDWAAHAVKNVVLADSLFERLSSLESPAQVAFMIDLPPAPTVAAEAPSVILDRVQDAGNVGAILRSAAAFGFSQVIALKGCAALWSPKVTRAAMGAHFALRLIEGVEVAALDALTVPIVATSSHAGEWLHLAKLPKPCAWVFGHEGQGARPELLDRAIFTVRIAQPGGEESLNVASAAAICLHASTVAAGGLLPL
jgi:RNA methyltransferase, TrmH family